MAKIWVVDNEPSARYPIYTRGNVGEVFPEPVAPLSWTIAGIPGSEQGWRDAFERFGAFDRDEFEDDNLNLLGVFGGYCYLNVSISRIFAVRTPGLTPDLMDQTLFGSQEAPPYEPRPTDESPKHTERIQQTVGWVLTAHDLPELVEDQQLVQRWVDARPDFAKLSNEQLLAGVRDVLSDFRRLFAQHIFVSYCATVPVGMINQICAQALGDPTLAMRLVAGIGGVDSATPSWAMWELARMAQSSPPVAAEFDKGVDGLYGRLVAAGADETRAFVAAIKRFQEQYGSRGPNEWEMRSPTWGTDPDMALAAVDRMRLAPDDADPQVHFEARAAEREGLTADIAGKLAGNPEVQGQFLAACHAAGVFLAGRERSKTTIIRLAHESRLRMHELGRRMVEAGHFEDVEDFGMLTDEEWNDFLVAPASFTAVIRDRTAQYEQLRQLEPPFVIAHTVPPIEQWPRRGSTPVKVAGSGETLGGIPGCPGSHTGRARVILDPDEPGALQPGDVLVAPITDPAWTPLFVTAGAVVVNVGAQVSHAVIVSRELGIPCVVSVTDATRRIPDGATVTVDGTSGVVTVH
jgi:pyruvate,water dikinase